MLPCTCKGGPYFSICFSHVITSVLEKREYLLLLCTTFVEYQNCYCSQWLSSTDDEFDRNGEEDDPDFCV